jgi:hypothetical protein
MEGTRDRAIQTIKEFRQKFQAASDPESRQKASEGFKNGVIALTIALKTE